MSKEKVLTGDWIFKNSGFLAQLIFSLKNSTDENKKKNALELQDIYTKKFPSLLKYIQDNFYVNLQDHMLLFSADGKCALVVSDAYYEKFLCDTENDENKDVNIDNFYYIKIEDKAEDEIPKEGQATTEDVMKNKKYSTPVEKERSLEEVFQKTVLFNHAYISHNTSKRREDFLKLLLPAEKEEKQKKQKLLIREDFTKACQGKSYTQKYVEKEKRREIFSALQHMFQETEETRKIKESGGLFDGYYGDSAHSLQLKKEYIEKILEIFPISNTEENLDKKNAAEVFANLCAFFVYCSSSYIFGTEGDSPTAVRNLAIAFLNEAISLNSDLFTEGEIINIKNKFSGTMDAFTCTAVLFAELKKKLKDTKYFQVIIPKTWY
jgi:hypothetical protein